MIRNIVVLVYRVQYLFVFHNEKCRVVHVKIRGYKIVIIIDHMIDHLVLCDFHFGIYLPFPCLN